MPPLSTHLELRGGLPLFADCRYEAFPEAQGLDDSSGSVGGCSITTGISRLVFC